LAETFGQPGEFTVFAPTNEAFSNVPEAQLQALLKPENKDQLINVLSYHVVPGVVTASEASNLRAANMLNGQRNSIGFDAGVLTIGNARVISKDIRASNGIVHVIDSVLVPELSNIVEVAQNAGVFNTLLAAATAAGLPDALAGEPNLTVFAPTDEAFEKLPAGTVETLLKPENRQQLIELLSYHVVADRIYSEELLSTRKLSTLARLKLPVALGDEGFEVANATITAADIPASNGVIHIVDQVLIPSNDSAAMKGSEAAKAIISKAIAKGAPLFNHGQQQACADIYEVAAFAMLEMDSIDPKIRERLQVAMNQVRNSHSHSQRAWQMRYAFDDALTMINEG
jgi:transforming growth factor-beta-induced protein